MRIAIYIIYVHDDIDISAYEYVNVCADGYITCVIYRWIFVYVRAVDLKLIREFVYTIRKSKPKIEIDILDI